MARRPQQLASSRISRSLFLMLLAMLCSHALAARWGTDAAPIRAEPAVQAAVPSMELPVFRLAELAKAGDDASILQRLRHAVFNVGMFAVSPAADPATNAFKDPPASDDSASDPASSVTLGDLPSAHEPASRSALPPIAAAVAAPALSAFARCAGDSSLDDLLHSVQLDDGSTRSTLATSTDAGQLQPLPREVQSRCPDLAHPASQLRAAVDQTGLAYAAVLDLLVNGQGTRAAAKRGKQGGGLDAAAAPAKGTAEGTARGTADTGATGSTVGKVAAEFDSYLDAVRHGESLEHFHLFSQPEGAGDGAAGRAASGGGTAALQMHSDVGLFIVMTPAQYFRSASSSTTTGGAASATRAAGRKAGGTAADPDPSTWEEVLDAEGQDTGDIAASSRPGLYLELPNGRVVRPVFPAGSLLVMNGEGCSKWMRAKAGAQVPPAAAHEVVLPTNMQGMVRAWYGRMYFPMSDATLQQSLGAGGHTLVESTHGSATTAAPVRPPPTVGGSATAAATRATAATTYGTPGSTGAAVSVANAMTALAPAPVTFGEYRRQTMAAFQAGDAHLASTVGCSTSRQLLQDQGSCPAGQYYCWMQCMNIPSDLGCSKDVIQCENPAGQIWPADFPQGDASHCFDCVLTCPAAQNATQNATIPVASGFCNSQLTAITMWMTGFQFSGISSGPCVALLFPTWSLDNEVKFAFACIGTFLLGMVSGALGYFRNALLKSRLRGPVRGSSGGGNVETLKKQSVSTLVLADGSATGAPSKGGWFGWLDSASPRVWKATHLAAELFLYAVQMTIAYFLMLIAMTYEAELFIMVVLGLTAGHGILLCVQDEAKQEGGAGECGQSQAMLAESNPEPCCCA